MSHNEEPLPYNFVTAICDHEVARLRKLACEHIRKMFWHLVYCHTQMRSIHEELENDIGFYVKSLYDIGLVDGKFVDKFKYDLGEWLREYKEDSEDDRRRYSFC